MAHVSSMGPPLSPRETRRSGRRSAPSGSGSASKSPDSDQPMREKVNVSRTAASSTSSRTKKLKQEDNDDVSEDRHHNSVGGLLSFGSNTASNSNKGKRKTKDKDKDQDSNGVVIGDADSASMDGQAQDVPDEEEEQGVTRCVCGSAEDDPEAGEFMVQCETCGVWQHGLCMGYLTEDQVQDTDYHCELCKPEMHVELLKRLAKKPRQTSMTIRQDPTASTRISRSHSPSYLLKQPSKRRNTMNSRDAAFDESLKEIIEATAAEAAAVQDTSMEAGSAPQPDTMDNGKRKRKRAEEETHSNKRTRSPSVHSEQQLGPTPTESPAIEKVVSQVPKSAGGRNKRGGRKNATIEVAAVEIEEVNSSHKRPGNTSRGKGSVAVKRPPLSQSVSHGSGAAIHEHGTRRNQSGNGQQGGFSAADSRAYRNSHAYAVSQQTLFTSWNLPDYLSHLEQMLPTQAPQPLEVRSGAYATAAGSGSRGESAELTVERGVKVKWPAKRTSVGDMNKRVRALVEWVGREQATGLDRGRRREALQKTLQEQAGAQEATNRIDGLLPTSVEQPPSTSDHHHHQPTNSTLSHQMLSDSSIEMSGQTMKLMEELMEELIGFQERFGPGAKNRDRERRLAA